MRAPPKAKKVATANCHRPIPDVFGGVELRRRVGASAGADRLRRGAVVHLAVHLALDFDFGSATESLLFTSHFDPRCSPRTAHTKLQLRECGRQTREPPGERVYGCTCVLPSAGRVVYLAMLRSMALVPKRALSRAPIGTRCAFHSEKIGRMFYRESSPVWKMFYRRKYRDLFLSHINCQVG